MKNKYLIMTAADNKFAKGAAVLLFSLRKHMARLAEVDIKVIYNNLTEENKQLIKHACPRVIFQKPADTEFCEGLTTLYGEDNQDTYLCFEAFRQHEYEKVICLDSDMMCIGDISPLLDYEQPMLACLSKNKVNFDHLEFRNGVDKFNAGFFVINKQILQSSHTYDDLTNMVRHGRSQGLGKSHPFNDQDVIKKYWRNKYVLAVPDGYNFRMWGGLSGNKQILKENERLISFFNKHIEDIKVIHYSGKRKPWGNKTVRDDGRNGLYDVCSCGDENAMIGVPAVDMWHDYYEECFEKKCETDWYYRKKK